MIISRTIAKYRIAQGDHPKWIAAWLPVLADGAVLFALLYLFFPFVSSLTEGLVLGWVFALFFVLYFIPIQIVLILSALWAARSRNTHDDRDQPSE